MKSRTAWKKILSDAMSDGWKVGLIGFVLIICFAPVTLLTALPIQTAAQEKQTKTAAIPAVQTSMNQPETDAQRKQMSDAYGRIFADPEFVKARAEYVAAREHFFSLQKALMIKADPGCAEIFQKIEHQSSPQVIIH